MKKIVNQITPKIIASKILDRDLVVVMNTDINKIIGFISKRNDNVYVCQRSSIENDFNIMLTDTTLEGVILKINECKEFQCYKL